MTIKEIAIGLAWGIGSVLFNLYFLWLTFPIH